MLVACQANPTTVHRRLANKRDITQKQGSGQIMENFTRRALVSNIKTQYPSTRHSMISNSSMKRSRLKALKNIRDPTIHTDMTEKLRVAIPSKAAPQRKSQNWTMSKISMAYITVPPTRRVTMHHGTSKILAKTSDHLRTRTHSPLTIARSST